MNIYTQAVPIALRDANNSKSLQVRLSCFPTGLDERLCLD